MPQRKPRSSVKPRLLQTTVNSELGHQVDELARADGLRVAPWLRRLVAREVNSQRSRARYWQRQVRQARRRR